MLQYVMEGYLMCSSCSSVTNADFLLLDVTMWALACHTNVFAIDLCSAKELSLACFTCHCTDHFDVLLTITITLSGLSLSLSFLRSMFSRHWVRCWFDYVA